MNGEKKGAAFNVNLVRNLVSERENPRVVPFDRLPEGTYRVALVNDGEIIVSGGTMPPEGIKAMRAYDQFAEGGGTSNVFVDKCNGSYVARCAHCSK